MKQDEYVWYQDSSFKFILSLELILGVIFTGGIWVVDGEFSSEPLYFFGAMVTLTVGLSYLFRKNP